MASYSLSFKPSVEKDLNSLPKPLIARVLDRLELLPPSDRAHTSAEDSASAEISASYDRHAYVTLGGHAEQALNFIALGPYRSVGRLERPLP